MIHRLLCRLSRGHCTVRARLLWASTRLSSRRMWQRFIQNTRSAHLVPRLVSSSSSGWNTLFPRWVVSVVSKWMCHRRAADIFPSKQPVRGGNTQLAPTGSDSPAGKTHPTDSWTCRSKEIKTVCVWSCLRRERKTWDTVQGMFCQAAGGK